MFYCKARYMKTLVTIIFLSLIMISGYAQENGAGDEQVIKNVFRGTRVVNGQSANLTDKGKLLFLVQHRFGDISGGLYQFFGLDQATMRMGFEYGFGNNLNVGIGRSSYLKTYDAFGKVRLAQQTDDFPLTIAATAAGFIPTLRNYFPDEKDNFSDKSSGNIQLHLAKTIDFIGLQVSPGFLSTGYLLSEGDNLSLFTLGLAGSARISKKVSANLEYLTFFNSEFSATRPLSLGVDIDIGGHLFQLILSNSQQMVTPGLYTGTMGDWSTGNLFFGFNLIREFRIKYY